MAVAVHQQTFSFCFLIFAAIPFLVPVMVEHPSQHCLQASWILRFICSSTSLMQMTIVCAFVWATGIRPIYSSHTVISLSPNICKLQAVQCCSHQCSHQPWYCSNQIQLCYLLYHATLLKPWFVIFHSEHSWSYACHKTNQLSKHFDFSSEK